MGCGNECLNDLDGSLRCFAVSVESGEYAENGLDPTLANALDTQGLWSK